MPVTEVRRGWLLAAEYSLILVAMLLFSERTWKHHCVTLLLPFAVLCYGLAPWFPAAKRRAAGIAAALAALLMLSTSSGVFGDDAPKVGQEYEGMTVAVGPTAFVGAVESGMMARLDLVPDSPGRVAQAYGAYVGAFLALMAGLAVMLARPRSSRDRIGCIETPGPQGDVESTR